MVAVRAVVDPYVAIKLEVEKAVVLPYVPLRFENDRAVVEA